VVLVIPGKHGFQRAGINQNALNHARSLPYAWGWC
jgi:hypothetical protein